MTRTILTRLQAQAYEHPFDRQALATLQKMPGLSSLLNKINEYGIDRLLRLQSLSSEIKITPQNFPKLHQALIETCEILDVKQIPELYLSRGAGHIRTYILGVEKPILGINLDCMEWLDSNELIYTLGYELAKIKSKHIAYHQMAFVMPTLKTFLSNSTLGIGGLLAGGIELALFNWVMMARLTSDRAGLLACQDIDVAITTLIKIAGLPHEYLTNEVIEDFQTQAREFCEFSSNNLDSLDKITKIFSYSEQNIPWSVMRAGELLKWVDSGEYDKLIQQKDFTVTDEIAKDQEEEEEEDKDNNEDQEEWDFLSSWT
ncbi:MAG TPA: M48 family metallopeptidase [Nostocaceae cyanobacterium]|nr:M48 family metallopeptidase [Nostocaceae cyanobacterium]